MLILLLLQSVLTWLTKRLKNTKTPVLLRLKQKKIMDLTKKVF
jgi:hypothetical protein